MPWYSGDETVIDLDGANIRKANVAADALMQRIESSQRLKINVNVNASIPVLASSTRGPAVEAYRAKIS